ncbi:MAG TPA: ABC transporter ATP-binding protein [Thioploca sp.]|nr:ABC transporter ATP-binding protein [Thioploca sp.]
MKVIELQNIGKTYTTYAHGVDQLLEIITHKPRHQSFVALHPLNLTISTGQVIGIIGDNGAGKSTLLKIISGTLQPTGDLCQVKGRVAALLELGSGFHPEMTGRENVYLNGTMMGLSLDEVENVYENIVEFAGIQDFMEQPVKTYSSGMFMRLAFAVATCVDPDILIIDEALSVGDGAFARKSFDRIMQFRQANKTILFCSHSLYQVESICDRVIWLDKGKVKMDGKPSEVVSAYNQFILKIDDSKIPENQQLQESIAIKGTAKLNDIKVIVDGMSGENLDILSTHSELCVSVDFSSDPDLLAPSIGIVLTSEDNRVIASSSTQNDNFIINRDQRGNASVRLYFPKLPLLRGEYQIIVYLMCENGIHFYDQADLTTKLKVHQKGLEIGVVSLPHRWVQI